MQIFRRLTKPSAFLAATILTLAFATNGCKKAAAPPSDDALTTALHNRFAADSALSTEPPIQATVQNGIATLNGAVSNDQARALAAADAAQVAGIKTVVNNLTVQAPAPAAAAAPPPAPEPTPRETRKPSPSRAKEKTAPVERQAPPKPVQQATVVPPPSAGENMAPPVSRPAPPPPPAFVDVTVPSGTVIPVRITQTLSSATSQIGDNFSGVVSSDVVIGGITAIPAGTHVSGNVSDVQEAAHYKGSSLLSVQLTGINPRGNRLAASSAPYTLQGKARGKNTAEKVGGGAAVGAILGGIFGGGKGAAIGAAAGGGLGAGANTVTKGEQVQIPSESIVRFHLSGPISLRVANNGGASGNNGAPSPQLQRRSDN
ncbi:hypothetical protein GCM10011507_28000 [Edaphobacter acidisoli]|uniref:BON domain-containing protein n=1 Tax=Edaphobacter acidisoli TaxID=2040573 RepID=A0A916W866_9BACT|nr:BON domain-containing protein [Edaphobacter acidisoli]GGA75007.1 hypothetical protein GCM10011507_28000 [Edaphobacter acidisoli]